LYQQVFSKKFTKKQKIISIFIAIIFIALVLFYFFYNHKKSTASNTPPTHNAKRNYKPISVVTVTTKIADVPVYISAPGTVTSRHTITVQAQVSGVLEHIYFKEGQRVKAGDVIAHIDSRSYEAQLLQYEGQLLRDQALLENAKLDLKRYRALYPDGSVSKQIYDTQVYLVKQDEGIVKSDMGLVKNAQINLSYCDIVSPVTGRIGLRIVDEGNYVQPSSTNGIVVINTTSPIDIAFSIAEDDLAKVREKFNPDNPLEVFAYDRTQTKLIAKGKLLTIDNQVDSTTGTIKLKAEFENEKDELFPDKFVNIKLLVETLKDSLILPVAAVQQGRNGSFVYLLNKDKTVHVQPVKTGETDGDNIAILQGLSLNQTVITEGVDKLFEGASVNPGKQK